MSQLLLSRLSLKLFSALSIKLICHFSLFEHIDAWHFVQKLMALAIHAFRSLRHVLPLIHLTLKSVLNQRPSRVGVNHRSINMDHWATLLLLQNGSLEMSSLSGNRSRWYRLYLCVEKDITSLINRIFDDITPQIVRSRLLVLTTTNPTNHWTLCYMRPIVIRRVKDRSYWHILVILLINQNLSLNLLS